MPGVTILYEDSAGERSQFALHQLVVRCVADRLDREPRTFEDSLRGYPKKGNANVRRACQQELSRLARDGRLVCAVYDSDEITQLVKLPARSCKTKIVGALKQNCDATVNLRVVLLIENTESLLIALRDLKVIPDRDAMFADAIDRKNLASRDILFKAAVWQTTPEQRAALLASVPSFGYLIDKVAAALT